MRSYFVSREVRYRLPLFSHLGRGIRGIEFRHRTRSSRNGLRELYDRPELRAALVGVNCLEHGLAAWRTVLPLPEDQFLHRLHRTERRADGGHFVPRHLDELARVVAPAADHYGKDFATPFGQT